MVTGCVWHSAHPVWRFYRYWTNFKRVNCIIFYNEIYEEFV